MKSIVPLLLGSGLLLSVAAQAADIQTETVTYPAGDEDMEGFIAYDADVEGKRPAVVVVHEWWGMTEHARDRARELAEAGYTAMAVDMYGGGRTAEHPEDAGEMAAAVRENMDRMTRRFDAGLQLVRQHETVDSDHVAAIGYCFGGGVVLEMARNGADLDAVASFHGSLATDDPAKPGDVQAPMLILHGEADQMVSEEDVDTFRKEMVAADAYFRLITYPDAMHSFTNPRADDYAEEFDLPVGYDEEAATESWDELLGFLDEHVGD
ncbi:MAG: dienelactone hydrolase family protein [Ectothiorhodospiraceae bacterium]